MSDSAPPLLTLRLFGPFEVCVNGASLLGLRRRQARWLLALLALRGSPLRAGAGRGGGVEREWLACMLWPDSATGQGRATMRRSLTDLRRDRPGPRRSAP